MAKNKGYVVYPSTRGFETLARARAAAIRESKTERFARIDRISDQKTMGVYRDGRLESRNAGLFSKRKTKKVRGKGGGDFDSWMKAKSKATKAKRASARKRNGKNIFYKVQHSGSITHFGTLSAAKRAAQRFADANGITIPVYKASMKEYNRTGSSYLGEVARVAPKKRNAGRSKEYLKGYREMERAFGGGKVRKKKAGQKRKPAGRPIEIRSKNPLGGLADLPLNKTVNTTLNKVPVRIRRTNSAITITKR